MQNRERKDLRAHWAWTRAEAKQYQGQGLAKELMAAARQVQERFAADNPGYTLGLSPLRSLERQVRFWCTNGSVLSASAKLGREMRLLLSGPAYPALPKPPEGNAFAKLLEDKSVRPEPTSAAPGTSDHGQLRAVDFVVFNGAELVATTDKSTVEKVWKAQGWEDKLIAAARPFGLIGPLPHPYEPWHWRIG